MKDLKLPIFTDEERNKIWNDLKAGDVLVNMDYNIWNDSYDIKQCTIVKRTDKGSLRLDSGTLLKFFSSNYYVLNDELQQIIDKIKLEDDIDTLIFYAQKNKKSFKNNLDYEDAKKLKEILDKCVVKSC